MGKFPVIVTDVKDEKTNTKQVTLETKGNEKSSQNRDVAMNKYIRNTYGSKASLCGFCSRGPATCEKMADISFKMISDYPFITEGVQIQDIYANLNDKHYADADTYANMSEYERTARLNNLKIKKLIVYKCKKFTTQRL